MAEWKFKDYLGPAGTNHIAKWYGDLSAAARVKFDDQIKMLAKIDKWQYPEFLDLRGKKYKGLSEIRFKEDRRNYRVIGVANSVTKEYVMLLGCFHKESYQPHDALDTAVRRLTDFKAGRGGVKDHEH